MNKPVGQDANATHVPPAEAAGDDPFGLAPWLKEMPDVPLHPLMAHPMAAMAATTAIGFGLAGQMAGAMLGVMQSAAERTKVMLDEAAELAAKADMFDNRIVGIDPGAGLTKAVKERVIPEYGLEKMDWVSHSALKKNYINIIWLKIKILRL